ncbi:hypothetical protein V1506DRAFT_547896 [Lipomyces tetrasporus]
MLQSRTFGCGIENEQSKRRICSGHRILVHDGFSYHPCAHGSLEKMRKCILPVQHLQDTMPNSDEQTSTAATTEPDPDDIATGTNDAHRLAPMMAQQLINRYRAITTDLGCWESKSPSASFLFSLSLLHFLVCLFIFVNLSVSFYFRFPFVPLFFDSTCM